MLLYVIFHYLPRLLSLRHFTFTLITPMPPFSLFSILHYFDCRYYATLFAFFFSIFAVFDYFHCCYCRLSFHYAIIVCLISIFISPLLRRLLLPRCHAYYDRPRHYHFLQRWCHYYFVLPFSDYLLFFLRHWLFHYYDYYDTIDATLFFVALWLRLRWCHFAALIITMPPYVDAAAIIIFLRFMPLRFDAYAMIRHTLIMPMPFIFDIFHYIFAIYAMMALHYVITLMPWLFDADAIITPMLIDIAEMRYADATFLLPICHCYLLLYITPLRWWCFSLRCLMTPLFIDISFDDYTIRRYFDVFYHFSLFIIWYRLYATPILLRYLFIIVDIFVTPCRLIMPDAACCFTPELPLALADSMLWWCHLRYYFSLLLRHYAITMSMLILMLMIIAIDACYYLRCWCHEMSIIFFCRRLVRMRGGAFAAAMKYAGGW